MIMRIVGFLVGSLGVVRGCWTGNLGLVTIAAFCLLAVIFNLKAEIVVLKGRISSPEMAAFYEENRKRRAGEIE